MLSFHVGDTVRIVKAGWDHQKIGIVRFTVAQHYEAWYRKPLRRQRQRRYYVETRDGTMHPFYAQNLKMIEANNHKIRPSTIWKRTPKVRYARKATV